MGKPIEILHMDRLKEVVKARNIEVAIIATPAQSAQIVATQLVDANIRGIMNFAPTQIKVPPNVVLRNVFFTSALDNLVYYLSR